MTSVGHKQQQQQQQQQHYSNTPNSTAAAGDDVAPTIVANHISPASTPIADVTTVLLTKATRDPVLMRIAIGVLLISLSVCLVISGLLGLIILAHFVIGWTLATVLLQKRAHVAQFCAERWNIDALFSGRQDGAAAPISGTNAATATAANNEPWKALRIDSDLDRAVDSFFTRILNTFITSWYGPITADEHFMHSVRQHLREALTRLILRVQHLNVVTLLTERLLPVCFAHYELVHAMQHTDTNNAEQLARSFHAHHRHTVHPAVRNRRTERDYLRALAAFLVPRLCPNAVRQQTLGSRCFESLLRELFAQWALLPLMDVLADPDLINLLVLEATTRSGKVLAPLSADGRVEFLARFAGGERPKRLLVGRAEHSGSGGGSGSGDELSDLLADQTQLYAFMQYLKREGAVDVLRFYLDVNALNADALDPKVTTDPAKLSALQQLSERLLATYRTMQLAESGAEATTAAEAETEGVVRTLAEAHEAVCARLLDYWRLGFRGTAEYYRVVYGDRDVREAMEYKDPADVNTGFRLGQKLKGALRSNAIDGALLDGAEVPLAAWDAFADESPTSSLHSATGTNHPPPNIYASVTQKLRKERGQRLDAFIANFMQSIEHVPDLGVDASASADETSARKSAALRKRTPPGRNPAFADLFAMPSADAAGPKTVPSSVTSDGRNEGASGCLIFILVRILDVPEIVTRFCVAIVAIARSTVDRIIGVLIERLLRYGLYEPRLTMLLTTLENHLFGAKKHEAVGHTELAERRRQARQRLGRIHVHLPRLVDVLQVPTLNKQLMYTLLDLVLIELWPELEPSLRHGR